MVASTLRLRDRENTAEHLRQGENLVNVVVIFGFVAGAASIIGLGITLHYARRSIQPHKRLVYEADVVPFPLVSSTSLEAYDLSVVYQPRGAGEERIGNAYVHYLSFANFACAAPRPLGDQP